MTIDYEPMWSELEVRLKTHDWFYAFSDDHSVWVAGQTNASEMGRLMSILKEVDNPRISELIRKHAPRQEQINFNE